MQKKLSRKVISVVVMIAFFSLVCFPAYTEQAQTDQPVKAKKQEKANQPEEKTIGQETKSKAETQAEAEVNEYYSRDDANVIEDEGSPGGKVKKFPWLLVVGGAIVVGAAVYFLLIKKPKYDLTVTVGEGVTGNPSSGTYKYKKGTTVNYSYNLQTGYTNLVVKVDGAAVPASGAITMDKNKTLTATATKVATLIVNSTPTGAQIILDGADSGQVTNHTFTFTSSGSHTITLRKVGYVEYTTAITVNLGDTQNVNKNLEKGLREYFNSGAATSILWKWQPYSSGNWSVSNGNYTANANLSGWNYSIYDFDWASTKYTVEVRMNRSVGSVFSPNVVYLSTTASGISSNGYFFSYTVNGFYYLCKLMNLNLNNNTASGGATIKDMTFSSALNTGLGSYNILKIVRDGSNYTFYINNQYIYSFNDSSFNPTYVFVGAYYGETVRLNFDYVFVSIDDTTGSVAGEPVKGSAASKEIPFFHKR